MIEDFGSYLKAERELRGVTLEELHAKTRIPLHYLQALEKNLFDELPEEVFIRAYIRSFAKVIGANEDEMLSAYIDITKTAPSIDTNNQNISNQNESTFDPKFIFILTFTILFLLGAVWSINILIRKFNMDSTKPTPTVLQQKQNKTKEEFKKSSTARNLETNDTSTTLEKTELPSKSSIIDPEITSKKSSNSLSTNPIAAFGNPSAMVKDEDTEEKLKLHADETPTVSTENDIPLKLTIKVKDDVWFNIEVDDSPVEDFLLARGSEKIFYGKKQFLLNVGNQNAVDLTLNGTVVNLPSGNKENIVKNFTITSELITH
jgi:cytoskeleton protein RodZ